MEKDEPELIRQCIAGRTQAFGQLVRRYQDRIYNTIYRMVGRTDDAQDLVQETFLKAYVALGKFRAKASFYTWLYRIAINVCLTQRRRNQRAAVLLPADGELDRQEPAGNPEYTRPSRQVESAECRLAVQRAINALPPDQRAVVVLKDIEGHSYETIADILECPIGTVRSRLHRARMQLKDRLREWCE